MKHYRINKLATPAGPVVKKIDMLAASDGEALRRAVDSADCPICEVLKDGEQVGSVV